jgi:predicted permease
MAPALRRRLLFVNSDATEEDPMSSLVRDFRHGVRMLLSNFGVSAIAIIALALGIGVTATMYSIVYGAMLKGLPFEGGDRLYTISRTDVTQEGSNMSVPIHDFLDWRAQQTRFEDIAGFYEGTVNVSGAEGPVRYDGAFISAATFELIDTAPQIGRNFMEGEDTPQAEPVVLLSDHVWRDRYNRDPSVIGKTLRANGEQMTIVGVMPEGFQFPLEQDIWLTLRLDAVALERGQGTQLTVIGLLPEDGSLEEAQAELVTLARQIELEYPDINENLSINIRAFQEQYIGDDAVAMLWTMLGAVFFVLLIACANVANLLLSRAFDRNKEVAIRSALGASRRRIIGQILVEASVLALIGAVIGIALASIGIGLFNGALADIEKPYWMDFSLNTNVLVFVIGVTLLATLLAGTLPAVQVTGGNLNAVLSDESRGSSSLKQGRLSRALVVFQVALSCGLLVAAGLMIKSVVNLGNTDYGFDKDAIMTARVGLFPADYPEVDDRRRFFEELHRRLQERSGVVAATLTQSLPAKFSGGGRFSVEGESYAEEAERPRASTTSITPGYFETFGLDLLQGRDFTLMDNADAPGVIIVNRSFAEKFFPEGNPLGRRISTGQLGTPEAEEWWTIVGVAPDLYMNGPQNEEPEGFYRPVAQSDVQFMSIAVRTQGNPVEFTAALREEVMAVDADMPIYWELTMAQVIHEETWFYWVFGTLFGAFGAVALLLASVGLYGVMSFSVRQRTAEVGIRMALGAESGRVLKLVMRQGLWQLGIGLLLGMALAYALAGLVESMLVNVEPTDPATFLTIVLTLLVTGLTASAIPALRASRIDPMIALRKQ